MSRRVLTPGGRRVACRRDLADRHRTRTTTSRPVGRSRTSAPPDHGLVACRRRRLGRTHPRVGERRSVVTSDRTSRLVGRRSSLGNVRCDRHGVRRVRAVHCRRRLVVSQRALGTTGLTRRRNLPRRERNRRSTFVPRWCRRHGRSGGGSDPARGRLSVGSSSRRPETSGEFDHDIGLTAHFRAGSRT